MENKKKKDWWKFNILYTCNKSHIMEYNDASSLVQLLWNLVKLNFLFHEEDEGILAIPALVTLILRGLSTMTNGRGRSLHCFCCSKKWNHLPSLFPCCLWLGNQNDFYPKSRTSWFVLHFAQFVLSRWCCCCFNCGVCRKLIIKPAGWTWANNS